MERQAKPIFKTYILPALLIALAYFPLFYKLDVLPLMQFDEARVAMSSYEMAENNNYIVVHYAGKPDMWSTKPPLTHWAQTFFIKTLGLSVLSVRLPSAIAGFLTCVLLWFFCIRYLKNHWLAGISIIVLVTSLGFVQKHVTRTADYDAILVLFTTASALVWFLFIETNNYKYLKWFFILLAFGVLTKSVAGLFLLPGLFLFSVINYKSLVFFKSPKTYLYLLYFLVPVFGYYLWREAINPGYIKAAWFWDIAGRYKEQLTGDKPEFSYYLRLIRTEHFFHWFWYAVAGAVLGFLIQDKRHRKFTLFLLCVSVCFIVVVSSARTQMLWYEAPVYPFLALLAAMALYCPVYYILKLTKKQWVAVFPIAAILVIAYIPYKNAIGRVNPPTLQHEWEFEAYSITKYLVKSYQTDKNIDGYYWLENDDYNPYIDFYARMFEKNKGQTITAVTPQRPRVFEEGDKVIGFLTEQKQQLESSYTFEVIDEYEDFVKVYKITGLKPSPTQSQ